MGCNQSKEDVAAPVVVVSASSEVPVATDKVSPAAAGTSTVTGKEYKSEP